MPVTGLALLDTTTVAVEVTVNVRVGVTVDVVVNVEVIVGVGVIVGVEVFGGVMKNPVEIKRRVYVFAAKILKS